MLLALSATPAQAQLTLFTENFEGLTLGPNQEEASAGDERVDKNGTGRLDARTTRACRAVSTTPPRTGSKSGLAGRLPTRLGGPEVDGQGREQFTRGSGTVMIADPDEWDDGPHPDVDRILAVRLAADDSLNPCMFDTFITTPTFTIPAGIPAGKIKIAFDSSWDDEGADDSPFLANNQRATINVVYNGGAPINVLTFDSVPTTSPNFHDTAYSEAVAERICNTMARRPA